MARAEFCIVRWENETLTEDFVAAMVGRKCPIDLMGKHYEGRIVHASIVEPQKGVEIHVDY